MRLWDRALTPEEVAWLYREPYCLIRTPAPRKWHWYSAATGDVTVTPSALTMTGAGQAPVPAVTLLANALGLTAAAQSPTPSVIALAQALSLTGATQDPTVSTADAIAPLLALGEDDLYL
jgi:hypothetical protein